MNAYDRATPEHQGWIAQLLTDTRANDGLAPVDLKQFWVDQGIANKDPFGATIPQVPLGATCNWLTGMRLLMAAIQRHGRYPQV